MNKSLFLLLPSLLMGSAEISGAADVRSVILDTDIGDDVDDAINLVLAARSPEIRLAAVVINGDDIARREALAREYLRLCGKEDVPVASGATHPILPGRDSASRATLSPMPAIKLMRDIVGSSEEPVTIVSVGAATNTALFLTLHPDLADRIQEIVIMGGAFSAIKIGDAQLSPTIETNLNRDPAASEIVLRSGLPIKLVPGELTFSAILHQDSATRIREAGTPMTTLLSEEIDAFSKLITGFLVHLGGKDENVATMSVLLHDPLALMSLLRPEILRFAPLRFDLLHGKKNDLYFAANPSDGEFVAEVANWADFEALESFVVGRILGTKDAAE